MKERPVVIGNRTRRQVAFVGPYGVGKTTAVRSLSDLPVVSTEVRTIGVDGAPRGDTKSSTTVGIDYGQWRGPQGVVGLYGTPGQERFDTIRNQAVSASTSLVLLVFGHIDNALDEADRWLERLGAGELGITLTVAVTRLDEAADRTLDDFRDVLDRHDTDIALESADPRSKDDITRVVLSALRVPVLRGPKQSMTTLHVVREEVG